MSDSITTVTQTSWLSRLGESIKNVLAGLALFAAGFPVLWINEGCSAKTLALIAAGKAAVVAVSATDVETADDGKLVHLSGKAVTDDELADDVFGVQAEALRMRRTVEILQWVEEQEKETRKKVGGGEETEVTYSYVKEWVDAPVDSSRFKDQSGRYANQGRMQLAGRDLRHVVEWTAPDVTLGDRRLTDSLLAQLSNWEPLPATETALAAMSEADRAGLTISGGTLYRSAKPETPAVGDLKIVFEAARATDVSVLSAQNGDTFRPWTTDKVDGEIDRLEVGIHSADVMFQHWTSSNSMRTWIVRGGGWMLMTIGLTLIFKPLVVVADVIPLFGNMLQFGVGLFAGVVAGACAVVTIAIAWLAYRPFLAIALIVVAAAVVVGLIVLGRKRRAAHIANAVG